MIEFLLHAMTLILKVAYAPLLILTLIGIFAKPILVRLPVDERVRNFILSVTHGARWAVVGVTLAAFALAFTHLSIEGRKMAKQQEEWQKAAEASEP